MGYVVVSILVNDAGHSVGAEIKNTQTGETQRVSTAQLRKLAYTGICLDNAILDLRGYVRAKVHHKPLNKVVLHSKMSAVQQDEILRSKKLLSTQSITVYHGSKDGNLKPQYGYGAKTNDYGQGFYTTPNKELAKEWAWSGYTSGNIAYVYEYGLSLSGLSVLNLTEYDSIYWVTELIANRRLNFRDGFENEVTQDNIKRLLSMYKLNTSNYDIIVGYRADDSYFQYAAAFVNGTIYKGTLDSALRFGELGIQVFIKSKRAFSALHQVAYESVPLIYKQRFNRRDKLAREKYSEIRRKQTTQDKRTVYDFLK